MNFKRIVLALALILSFWGAARFTHHQTKGFRLSKITHKTAPIPSEHAPIPLSLLNQKFTYLGRGIESFSFLSEDKKTVLKIFNNRHQRRILWLKMIPFFKKWQSEKIASNQNKSIKAFQSYTLAYKELKEEAGLIAYHPTPCQECPTVTIVDPLRIEHRLCLQNCAFVLQKKAELPYPYIQSAMEEQNEEKAKNAIYSLVSLMKTKMEKGIADNDPLVRANFGFHCGKAMQIDIGPFSLDLSLKEKTKQKEEAIRMTKGFKHWLETHYPNLVVTLDDALENL